jgi:hypothetical protein
MKDPFLQQNPTTLSHFQSFPASMREFNYPKIILSAFNIYGMWRGEKHKMPNRTEEWGIKDAGKTEEWGIQKSGEY